jgi:uncharacterized protein
MSAPDLESKRKRLDAILKDLGSALVAFSGGVDSTFLVAEARHILGRDKVLAVTADSETYAPEELQLARDLAVRLDVKHLVVQTRELDVPNFRHNPPDRCYWCKRELFTHLARLAKERGLAAVCDGANADDPKEHRPGLRAAAELGVRSPLKEAGLTKDDIRALSRAMNLPTWNRPAMACLASRFPYGREITPEALERVAAAERFLRELGYETCRVRDHFPVARIEVAADALARLLGDRERITRELKTLGYTYTALDLEGYRPGAMDETLPNAERGMGNAE